MKKLALALLLLPTLSVSALAVEYDDAYYRACAKSCTTGDCIDLCVVKSEVAPAAPEVNVYVEAPAAPAAPQGYSGTCINFDWMSSCSGSFD